MKHKIFRVEYSTIELLYSSWEIFKTNFRLIAFITLIVKVPIGAILYFLFLSAPIEKEFIQVFVGPSVTGLVSSFFYLFVGIIASMAIAFAIKTRLDDKKIGVKTALDKAISIFPAAIATIVFMLVLLFLLELPFMIMIIFTEVYRYNFILSSVLRLFSLIPAVIAFVYWAFTTEVIILKNKLWKQALDYSKSVVKGRWWKVLGVSFMVSIPVYVLEGVRYSLFSPVMYENFLATMIYNIFRYLISSFFYVVWVMLFINLDNAKTRGSNR